MSNAQDFRHSCGVRGVKSVCHVCEDLVCQHESGPAVCRYQLQGAANLPNNVPTVTDTPFAIGPNVSHRYQLRWPNFSLTSLFQRLMPCDCLGLGAMMATGSFDFERASVVCLWLSGGECVDHRTQNFSSCALRCWGSGYPSPQKDPNTIGWLYNKSLGLPQGRVSTLAGN